MMMASSALLRCLYHRNNIMASVGSGVVRRWINTTSTTPGGGNIIRSFTSTSCTSTLPSRVSPWLMLSGLQYDKETEYKFFGFKENRTITFSKSSRGPGSEIEPNPVYKGSSHGWLIWMSRHNCDIFLTNPISGCHIRLPTIFPLFAEEESIYPPWPKEGTVETRGKLQLPPIFAILGKEENRRRMLDMVHSVILSSSPEDPDSDPIALMIYGESHRLAFCRPTKNDDFSAKWIPLDNSKHSHHVVYSTKHQLFYCSSYKSYMIVKWDLHHPSAPTRTPMEDVSLYGIILAGNKKTYSDTHLSPHLVIDPSGDLLLVQRRYVKNPSNEPLVNQQCLANNETTKLFRVYKFYPNENKVQYLGDSLPDDCVLFLGKNHSIVLKASDFPEFIPNSIYFTTNYGCTQSSGNHDIEIFNYRDKSVSPCDNYSCDRSKFEMDDLSPIWITPNPGF